jgi:hypothetical protein
MYIKLLVDPRREWHHPHAARGHNTMAHTARQRLQLGTYVPTSFALSGYLFGAWRLQVFRHPANGILTVFWGRPINR